MRNVLDFGASIISVEVILGTDERRGKQVTSRVDQVAGDVVARSDSRCVCRDLSFTASYNTHKNPLN